ncbi:MAG: hypothetical protein HY340_02905 [Candidatus Kerfeldbacteria bacterium]|nr:hypothetical protein [Candidatus Kerfeldbacteria bacterium]
MRQIVLVLSAVAVVLLSGCDNDEIINVNVGFSSVPDLRVQVWDVHFGGPYQGAFVEVFAPPGGLCDDEYTDAYGWTPWLLVPREAERVQVAVTFLDERRNPQTWYGWIHLERGATEVRFHINTDAP